MPLELRPIGIGAKLRSVGQRKRSGFTLVELLVVIAIIGVLVALLLPAVQAAREAARRSQCLNNLRQLSLGLLNYESAHKAFPLGFEYTKGLNPASLRDVGPNWAIRILPHIEQQSLYDLIDFNYPISNPQNAQVREARLDLFLCPSDSLNSDIFEYKASAGGVLALVQWGRGNYGANAGNGPTFSTAAYSNRIDGPDSPGWENPKIRGVLGPNVGATLQQITDGTSNTFLLGELRTGIHSEDRRGVWALGQTGASMIAFYGSTGDANGPNVCNDFSDDTLGCRATDYPLLRAECMTCYAGSVADQATMRSQHLGGVNVGLVDGSSHFVSNDIETSGTFGDWGTVWDKYICSADGLAIEEKPF